ncbi:hypothetical protein ACQ4M3_40835 [Leptolyngbya sp. AN03gr2]|uniref:hypothetical protein n=1 Tax=unclassified Leptolyngbya TaxID=2650499 RepID=UPI003D315338
MSSLEALQRRLEVFREAGRNLQLDPLITPEDLARLGVEYQTEMIDELEQANTLRVRQRHRGLRFSRQ